MRCMGIIEESRDERANCKALQLLLSQSLNSAVYSIFDIWVLQSHSWFSLNPSKVAFKPMSWVPSRCWIVLCRICQTLGSKA